MSQVGTELAKMHMADVIHGDLTTSNMMLSQQSDVLSSNQQSEVVGKYFHCATLISSVSLLGSYRFWAILRLKSR